MSCATAVILVDSSIWISHFRGQQTPAVVKLANALEREPILMGDIILLELLQGARDDAHAADIEAGLRQFEIVQMLDTDLAIHAARNYRTLRRIGVTIRKTADLIIGTFCIEYGHSLLHDDRDFTPMEKHLGLRVM